MTSGEPPWSSAVRAHLASRTVIAVAIGPAQLLPLAAAGATIVGVISVVPAGGPPPPETAAGGVPLLTLEGSTRDILDHVVRGYAETIERGASRIERFVDDADPDRRAAVVSYLPVPHGPWGGRACWTADAAVSRVLETKVAGGGLLAGVVPTIPSICRPEGPPASWWDETCARFGADRLVVQEAGLRGGGTGTVVCDHPSEVPLSTSVDSAIVLPFVRGRSGNVMGVVDEDGTTLVLPASRQLLRHEDGRPLYAGNVTGEAWALGARAELASDVRRIGRALAGEGFVGPFGVDFIDGPEGRRYHDLNPRMNGVVDSLSFLLDGDGRVPLVAALLARTAWTPAEAQALEDDLHTAAARRPLARLWLTRTAVGPRTIAVPPAAGRWRIDHAGAVTRLADERRAARPSNDAAPGAIEGAGAVDDGEMVGDGMVRGSVAVLAPLVPPGLEVRAGDRLALGNLFADPALVEALGVDAVPGLVDAFLA